MKQKTIEEINQIYDLEIGRIISEVKKQKAKKILLQFPEGLKMYSQAIADEIEKKTNSSCFIWLGTCFGACDIPAETEKLGIDLLIHFGHSKWKAKL